MSWRVSLGRPAVQAWYGSWLSLLIADSLSDEFARDRLPKAQKGENVNLSATIVSVGKKWHLNLTVKNVTEEELEAITRYGVSGFEFFPKKPATNVAMWAGVTGTGIFESKTVAREHAHNTNELFVARREELLEKYRNEDLETEELEF